LCWCGFGKELLDQGGDVMLEGFVAGGIAGAGETRIGFFHVAVAAEEEGCWPAVEVDGLREFVVELVSRAADQYGIGDAVVRDKGFEALGVGVRIALLEVDVYDFETATVELLVEAHEEWGFVMAVRAPGAADGDNDHLAAEFWVGTGDGFAAKIRKAEGEGDGWILDGRLLGGVGRSGKILLACIVGTVRYEVILCRPMARTKQVLSKSCRQAAVSRSRALPQLRWSVQQDSWCHSMYPKGRRYRRRSAG